NSEFDNCPALGTKAFSSDSSRNEKAFFMDVNY
ncbi:MAG: hypothetical protein ACI837_003098, partial [Crocinitomicaceae bacterium]